MFYLQAVGRAFAAIARDAGAAVRFQVGEPWWWVRADGRICLYDAAAVSAFAPVSIADVRVPLDEEQKATLDAAGAVLAPVVKRLGQLGEGLLGVHRGDGVHRCLQVMRGTVMG